MRYKKGALVIPRDANYPNGVLAVDGYDTTGLHLPSAERARRCP